LAQDDEQTSEQHAGPETIPPTEWKRRLAERQVADSQPAPPPAFAGNGEDAPEADASERQPPPPAPEAPPDGAFDASRKQLREQAERARSGLQQLLLSENERLRGDLTGAIQELEEKLRRSTQSQTEAELERIAAEVRTSLAAEQQAAQAQLAETEERLRTTLEQQATAASQAAVSKATPQMHTHLQDSLTERIDAQIKESTAAAGQELRAEATVALPSTGSNTGPYSRWGDYSSIVTDPADDCTFWYTTEYLKQNGGSFTWSTRIVSFKFGLCP